MLTKSIFLKSFLKKKSEKKLKKLFYSIINQENQVFKSMSKDYVDKYNFKKIKKISKKNQVRIIGMGGSILGAQAIYCFLKDKIKKNFDFTNNLNASENLKDKKEITNLVISKSGNTLETIINVNLFLKKKKNIFITERKESYLFNLASKLKAEIINHNNFIGGRYSVLSEVGMLPAHLMGLNPKKFRCLNDLIKNKKFVNLLVQNTNSILHYSKEKKFN